MNLRGKFSLPIHGAMKTLPRKIREQCRLWPALESNAYFAPKNCGDIVSGTQKNYIYNFSIKKHNLCKPPLFQKSIWPLLQLFVVHIFCGTVPLNKEQICMKVAPKGQINAKLVFTIFRYFRQQAPNILLVQLYCTDNIFFFTSSVRKLKSIYVSPEWASCKLFLETLLQKC